MSIQPHFKHGIGRLTAAAEGSHTRLTQVSHKAPMRWVPVWKTSVERAGAAICALSNYGGGMLQGDSVEVHVHVQSNAQLGVTTQGASRIYTQRIPNNVCQATLDAKVEKKGLLVWAPDPCSLFRKSSFQQVQKFTIDPTSSVALIDWFSSGRYRNGEHWAFDQLSTRTSLFFEEEDDIPILQDAIHMDFKTLAASSSKKESGTDSNGGGTDPLGVFQFHAFASLILYGDQVQAVQQECLALSDALLRPYTRIRERLPVADDDDDGDDDKNKNSHQEIDLSALGLSGRVCMGISRIPTPHVHDAHVVRFAATTNEDLYRIFHHCLSPLQSQFGIQFYKDRIRAKASEIPRMTNDPSSSNSHSSMNSSSSSLTSSAAPPMARRHVVTVHGSDEPPTQTSGNLNDNNDDDVSSRSFNADTMWAAYMMADSALPTGSFAHSAGLEVAAQMGILASSSSSASETTQEEQLQQLSTFIQAAVRSSVQMTAPFLVRGYELGLEMNGDSRPDTVEGDWQKLDRQCHAAFVTNALACAASIDQGKSLARVAEQWLGTSNENVTLDSVKNQSMIACFGKGKGHLGPIVGALGARLGLSQEQVGHLFGYCVARDMVSSAVRLSLIGPLTSVKLLQSVQDASKDGWKSYQRQKAVAAATAAGRVNVGGGGTSSSITHPATDPLALSAASAPILEAIHPCHEALQVRLFRT